VSYTSDAQFGYFTDDALDHRTVTEIQEIVTKKSERNALFRFVNANSDKEKIAGWKWKLRDLLQLFTVCPVVFPWSSLIVLFQAEVVLNTHVNVSKIQEGISGQVQPVSTSWIQSSKTEGCLQLPRLKPGQQLRLHVNPATYSCIQRTWRITSPATKGLFRTRRADREDRWSRRRVYTHCSHRCRGDREDVHRFNCPPRPSRQATVWREPQIHSLRPVPGFARSSPQPHIQGRRRRC
jgi:hypothetical protein